MGLGMKRMEMVFIEESDVRYGFGVEDLGVVNLKFKLFVVNRWNRNKRNN